MRLSSHLISTTTKCGWSFTIWGNQIVRGKIIPIPDSQPVVFGGIRINYNSDGSIVTQDLFIASDAINISVIGTANMVREDLDFTIGVQPLQTVDKIVNRIPVVGWLLTGKDKGFLTVLFRGKGEMGRSEGVGNTGQVGGQWVC